MQQSTRRGALAAPLTVLTAVALLAAAPQPTAASTASPTVASTADPRPNIVVVLADDLGYNDTSSDRFGPGSPVNRTPAIERLAAEGLVATDAYSAPTCAPTRMALLTGLAAPRADNNAYQVGGLRPVLEGAEQGQEGGRIYITEPTRTVAETARDAGYATGYVGKFHVARESSEIETHHGFDTNLGGMRGFAADYHATGGAFDPTVGEALNRYADPYTQEYVDTQIRPFSEGVPSEQLDALVGADKHVSDAVGDAMLDLVGVGDRPTFTMVGHYAVHSPVDAGQARPDLRAKYADATATGSGYAALVEGMDQTVGRLVRHLETTPDPRDPDQVLADNTVVILTSDNGGRTDVGADNAPWSGQKFELLEGGVRVPFVAWSGDPGLVRPGVLRGTVENVDLHPTVAEYAGADVPTSPSDGEGLDGVSLVGAFSGTSRLRPRAHVVHLPGYFVNQGRRQRPETSVRWRNLKLTYRYESATFRLSNLGRDPGETRNLARRRPDDVLALGRRMADWLARMRPRLARLREDAEAYGTDVPAGSLVYRDHSLVEIDSDFRLEVESGDEAPFILPPAVAEQPPDEVPGETPPAEREAAVVVRVLEGDTVLVDRPDGGRATVRLLGVRGPSAGAGAGCDDAAARRSLRGLLSVGSPVRLDTDPGHGSLDRSGRWWRYVTTQADGRDASRYQLARGAVRRRETSGPPLRKTGSLSRAEATAQRAERGVWGDC